MADAGHDDETVVPLAQVQPPARDDFRPSDTRRVRGTSRRKHMILIACTVAAVMVVGAGVVVLSTSGNRSADSVLSPAQLEDLADSAGRALREQTQGFFDRNVAVTAEAKRSTHGISHHGSSPLKWSEGQEFELAALCMGRGRVTVHWQAPGSVTGKLPLTCNESGNIVRTRFTPRSDGQLIEFRLTSDDAAVDGGYEVGRAASVGAGQIARASSVNAAAIRVAGGASILSS